jgi:hypothetical protein
MFQIVVVAIGMISDGDSVPELGAEVSKVTGPSWCEHPDPEEKGTTGLHSRKRNRGLCGSHSKSFYFYLKINKV